MDDRPGNSDNREKPITRLHIPPEMIVDTTRTKYVPPKPDRVLIALSVISVVSWLMVVAALLFVLQARPESENLFRFFVNNDAHVFQKTWKSELLHVAFYIMLANFCLSVIGTVVRLCKKKPFTRNAVSLLILGVLSLVMAVVLFVLW